MKDTIMEAVGAVAAGRNRKFTLRKADGFIYDEGPGFESHPATKKLTQKGWSLFYIGCRSVRLTFWVSRTICF